MGIEEYEKAKEALEGKRDDVYPCREDVPAELWGKPIPKVGNYEYKIILILLTIVTILETNFKLRSLY
jgi:hypothetical protein